MGMQRFDIVQELLATAPASAALVARLDDGPYGVDDLLSVADGLGLRASFRSATFRRR